MSDDPSAAAALRPISSVAVIGAGTMGSQIAQQIALNGLPVRLFDNVSSQLGQATQSNKRLLSRRVEKGSLTSTEAQAAVDRVELTTKLETAVQSADLVIEAIAENQAAKIALFRELDDLSASTTILATNSSTMTVSDLTSSLANRERTVALHFFNPALVMRLVEIAPAPYTAGWVVPSAAAFCRAIDRTPVVLACEIEGLIANRIVAVIRREAFWLVEHGYASPADVDEACRLGLRHPMGPFELADFNGLDIVLAIAEHRHAVSGDERDRPPELLIELVAKGNLGRKSGKGFYDYSASQDRS